jgi:hypothetical protein
MGSGTSFFPNPHSNIKAKSQTIDCTPKAITHRIAKIKSESKGVGGSTPTATTTPKRARAPAAPKTPKSDAATSKSRSARKTSKPVSYAQSDDDEDKVYESSNEKMEDGGESPTKKARTVKEEVVEEDGV